MNSLSKPSSTSTPKLTKSQQKIDDLLQNSKDLEEDKNFPQALKIINEAIELAKQTTEST